MPISNWNLVSVLYDFSEEFHSVTVNLIYHINCGRTCDIVGKEGNVKPLFYLFIWICIDRYLRSYSILLILTIAVYWKDCGEAIPTNVFS